MGNCVSFPRNRRLKHSRNRFDYSGHFEVPACISVYLKTNLSFLIQLLYFDFYKWNSSVSDKIKLLIIKFYFID